MTTPIDLSALTPEEQEQFQNAPQVFDSTCESVCCIYLRYSCNRQTEQSIEGQLRESIKFCVANRYRVAAVYVDRILSGRELEHRSAFAAMIHDSRRAPWKIVLVYALDRFARNREDAAISRVQLRRNGCRVVSATQRIENTPEGKLMEALLEGMAEFYSAELAQKVNRGMDESARKCNSVGGTTPLGYKIEKKKLVIDPLTAPIVQEAFTRYASGEAAADICRDFTMRGYRTSRGNEFNKNSLVNMFANEKYIGVYTYKNFRTEGGVPRLISDELWEAVAKRRRANAAAPARAKAKVDYLLSGKIFCGHCGSPMVGECGRGKSGKMYHYYSCASRKGRRGCDKKPVPKEWIEDVVAESAAEMLTDDIIAYIAKEAVRQAEAEDKRTTQVPAIKQQIRDIEKRLRNLMAALETAESAPDILVKRISDLEAQKKGLTKQLQEEEQNTFRLTEDVITFFLEAVRANAMGAKTKKSVLLDIFVNSVTVYDDDPGFLKITTAYNITKMPEKAYRIPLSKSSDINANGSPIWANPNTVIVLGLICLNTRKYALP